MYINMGQYYRQILETGEFEGLKIRVLKTKDLSLLKPTGLQGFSTRGFSYVRRIGLPGSDGYVVNNHGDRKCGYSPYQWPKWLVNRAY